MIPLVLIIVFAVAFTAGWGWAVVRSGASRPTPEVDQ